MLDDSTDITEGLDSCLSILQLLTWDITTNTLFPHLSHEEMKKLAFFSRIGGKKKVKVSGTKISCDVFQWNRRDVGLPPSQKSKAWHIPLYK